MDVKTKNMGIVSVDEEHILTLPDGLFGFEDYKKYALIETEYKPLLLLQSIDEKNLSFYLIDPFIICEDYEVDVDDKLLKRIDLTNPADVWVMSIVTIPPVNCVKVTANLQGPLIINKKNKKCIQVVLAGDEYSTKYDILAALKRGDAEC